MMYLFQVKYLISLFRDGMDEAKFVGKLLHEFFTNSLAKCISWEGTEGTKIPFIKSKINNAFRSKYFAPFFLSLPVHLTEIEIVLI